MTPKEYSKLLEPGLIGETRIGDGKQSGMIVHAVRAGYQTACTV